MKKSVWMIWLVPVLLAVILYCFEFSVPVSEEKLETAIEEYNFTTDMDVDILARQKVKNRLFVLYAQLDHPGWGGLAELERGPFGGYRFRSCRNFDGQLYRAQTVTVRKQPMLLLYGLHALPGVEQYQVRFGTQVVESGYARLETAPFLQAIPVPAMAAPEILYFDEAGAEIEPQALKARIPLADGGNGSATYTAEAGMIYVFMALPILCGAVIAWKLVSKERRNES